jgi:F-type H+/Na+-transporting ATPase subunit alpha
MVELLKQLQYMPYNPIDQCISIFAGTRGLLDDVEVRHVPAFERDLLEYFRGPKKELRRVLTEAKSFKGLEDQFTGTIKQFKSTWQPPQTAAAPARKA